MMPLADTARIEIGSKSLLALYWIFGMIAGLITIVEVLQSPSV